MSRHVSGEPQEGLDRAGRGSWLEAVVVAVVLVIVMPVVVSVVAKTPVMVTLRVAAVAAGVAVLVAAGVVAGVVEAWRSIAKGAAAVDATKRVSVSRELVGEGILKSRPSPPLLAEKLLLLVLPPRISDPIVGDLAERFPSIQERHGDWFARAWYWRHAVGAVTRFIGPRLAAATSLGAVLRVARRLLSR
jgi:hypothetical protein